MRFFGKLICVGPSEARTRTSDNQSPKPFPLGYGRHAWWRIILEDIQVAQSHCYSYTTWWQYSESKDSDGAAIFACESECATERQATVQWQSGLSQPCSDSNYDSKGKCMNSVDCEGDSDLEDNTPTLTVASPEEKKRRDLKHCVFVYGVRLY